MNDCLQPIKWSEIQTGEWRFYLAKTDHGLCYVGTPEESFQTFTQQITKRFPNADIIEDSSALEPYVLELSDYLNGHSQRFSLPTDIKGTTFQQEVWEALKQIPYGHTMSYSEIATLIGRPTAVRAAGSAIGANPLLITIPCHRVIGKNGTMAGYRGGLKFKQFLLQLEAGETTVN